VTPLHLSAYTLATCLGRGLAPNRAALRDSASGLKRCDFETVDLPTFVGEIEGVDAHRIPASLARFDCRNNRAGDLGLAQDGFIAAVDAAIARYGAGRIGVFMGTSTAGILQTEQAYRRRDAGDGAMEAALAASGLEARSIDYVNLHGTGTPSNDAAEDKAVHGLFGERVACSSTKGLTGHALGAAGAVEALLAVLALEDQHVPGSPGTRNVDPQLRANYQVTGSPQPLARVMSNSFGFGGSNCSLVFGRLHDAR